jgi:streptogramin lyase
MRNHSLGKSTRFGKRFLVPTLALLAAGLAGIASGQIVTEFTIPTGNSSPALIATSRSDGNLWFTEQLTNQIGRITTAGLVTEFPVPTVDSGLTVIAAGYDGNMWFTEATANKIGWITTSGVITEFPVPTPDSGPGGIAARPDGSLWFTEVQANKIGRITTAGVITEFPIPTPMSAPLWIEAGPDGNLWFIELLANQIARMTTAGVITEFPIPTAMSLPFEITTGPDGNLWFTEALTNKIGRITPAGVITEFVVPTANSGPAGITSGPDGNLWFTESETNQIGRITISGVITEFPVSTPASHPAGIATGSDGNLWFTEGTANQIGRITTTTPGPCVADFTTLCLNGGRFKVQVAWSAPDQAASGDGKPMPLTGDTGYFWFFNSANVELVIKVLDARPIGDHHFWVFYGALSDVAYTITVTDTETGAIKKYENPYHTLASVADTSAFAAETAGTEAPQFEQSPLSAAAIERLSTAELYALYGAVTQTKAFQPLAAPCTAGGNTLCLNDERFQVTVAWSAPSQGRSGHGTAVPLTGDTGYFWFFNDANVELVIKVLDGQAINGHFWVFYGALSNVQYTITVTDTHTQLVKTYTNPDGTLASVADTAAF